MQNEPAIAPDGNLRFAIFRLDEQRRITFLNRDAESLAGRPRAALLDRPLAEAVPALTRAWIDETRSRAVQAGEEHWHVLLEHDGQEWDVWVVPDVDGSCAVYAVPHQSRIHSEEISAMREHLVRERRLYETVLSGTPDFAYIWSLDYKFLYANSSLLKLYGLSAEQCIGHGFRDVGYPEWHAAMHEREIDEVARTGQPLRGRIPFYAKGGGGIYDYIFVPVLGPDGRVEAVGGITRDVTELERTTEALKEADRRKDEFLATLAHELRNPLAPLITGLQIVKDAPASEVAVTAIATMDRQLNHMVHLVDDLLDLSRVSRGVVELRRSQLDLRSVLQNALDVWRSLLRQHGHELSWRVPDHALPVEGDDTRLTQVFGNLLNNAAKFTPDRGTITLEARVADGRAIVAVSDTGVGIHERDLLRVFDMFTQVEPGQGPAKSGLGIGLHVVRQLVNMHGGSIEARSAGLGQGSTFTVSLPLSVAVSGGDPIGAKPVTSRARRVMIVDDNVDAAFTLSLLLKMKGHVVHATYGAREALELADTFRPEVIFLDIGMPELDGYEACRRIRQMENVKHAYVVALTGWGQEEDQREARAAGFDAHLVKPCLPERIDAVLAEMPDRLATVT